MKKIKKVSLVWFYNNKKEILLQERWDYSKYGEDWAFFGWHKEWEETPEETFIREAKEELDLDMRDFDYKHLWEFVFEFPNLITHRNIFLIKTDLKDSDFKVLEWIWAKYFSIEDARTLRFPSPVDETLDIIEEYINKN